MLHGLPGGVRAGRRARDDLAKRRGPEPWRDGSGRGHGIARAWPQSGNLPGGAFYAYATAIGDRTTRGGVDPRAARAHGGGGALDRADDERSRGGGGDRPGDHTDEQ